VQARAIGRFLTERGAKVEFASQQTLRPKDWDYAVLFNVGLAPTAVVSEQCRRSGVPYILFPVFWDLASTVPMDHRRALSRSLPAGSARRRAMARLRAALTRAARGDPRSSALLLSRSDPQLIRRVAAGALAVCPNSIAEAEHLSAYTGDKQDERWHVVRNGIWPDELPGTVPWSDRRTEVLCLGALSPRKNSLTLVRAAREAGVTLRIVGQRQDKLDGYARRAMAMTGESVIVEGFRKREDVLALLASTRAHAQVGFAETPGLATLEAVALSVSAIVGSTPVVKEYLPHGVWSVDPRSVESVAKGLEGAISTPPPVNLADEVRSNYSWPRVLQPLANLLGLGP
jgi:glycosyltransferase involved in cell wall biosynthesis